MAIKLKNKYTIVIALVISAYICGISVLSVSDLIKNREYLRVDSYFDSADFNWQLGQCFTNIEFRDVYYKDYSLKSDDDKVTKDELIASKRVYDDKLMDKENEVKDKYRAYIDMSKEQGDDKEVNRLTELRDKELEQVKLEESKTLEDLKKEIAGYKNKDYENIKKALEESEVKYCVIDNKNNIIDTNIKDLSNLDEYIEKNAMYSTNREFHTIDARAKDRKKNICFIIPKGLGENSNIMKNYNYYNSVKERLHKEVVIGIISFLIGLPLIIFILKKNNEDKIRLIKCYKKVPLDLKIIIFAIYTFIMLNYLNKAVFFIKPYRFQQVCILTIVAIYVLYLAVNIKRAKKLITSKEDFKLVVKECLVNRILNYFRNKPAFQNIKFKTRIMIILTLLFGVITLGVFALMKNSNETIVIVIGIANILFYMIFMMYYIFKISRFIIRITEGTEEIVSGNLNYTIEEVGRGEFLKIANNINNMKAGFKKALENDIKSERFKSELITNVSHDLKTPLTSIINYVGLLKKEGISNEEADRYINVLDRKSQRLKVIIDDLFEASKMASGAVDLEMERLEVTSILKQTLGEFDEAINNSELTFRLKLPEEKVYANLDGKKTWRVFENLINNILKYSQAGTRVYIALKEEDNKIIITMKNTSSYEMDFESEEIFERFKRGDKSRSTEGTGLGLSIAKSIIEIQGGNLNIEVDGDLFKAKVVIPSVAL